MCEVTADVVLELACDNTAPGTARALLIRSACQVHVIAVDDGLLLLSELVSNAVVHAGPPVMVAFSCYGRGARIAVHDGSSQVSDVDPPALEDLRGFDDDVDLALPEIAEHGRGLVFMDMIADCWDVAPDGTGKWINFCLAVV